MKRPAPDCGTRCAVFERNPALGAAGVCLFVCVTIRPRSAKEYCYDAPNARRRHGVKDRACDGNLGLRGIFVGENLAIRVHATLHSQLPMKVVDDSVEQMSPDARVFRSVIRREGGSDNANRIRQDHQRVAPSLAVIIVVDLDRRGASIIQQFPRLLKRNRGVFRAADARRGADLDLSDFCSPLQIGEQGVDLITVPVRFKDLRLC